MAQARKTKQTLLIFGLPLAFLFFIFSGIAVYLYQKIEAIQHENLELSKLLNEKDELLRKSLADITKSPEDDALETNAHIIPACFSEVIEPTLATLLKERIPQSIEEQNEGIVLTYNTLIQGEELYFDAERNKRFCQLIVSYDAENAEGLIEESAWDVLFEAIMQEDENFILSIITYNHLGKVERDNSDSTNLEDSSLLPAN